MGKYVATIISEGVHKDKSFPFDFDPSGKGFSVRETLSDKIQPKLNDGVYKLGITVPYRDESDPLDLKVEELTYDGMDPVRKLLGHYKVTPYRESMKYEHYQEDSKETLKGLPVELQKSLDSWVQEQWDDYGVASQNLSELVDIIQPYIKKKA